MRNERKRQRKEEENDATCYILRGRKGKKRNKFVLLVIVIFYRVIGQIEAQAPE